MRQGSNATDVLPAIPLPEHFYFGFFGLLVFVDVGLFSYGWYNSVPFKELAEMLWDSETQALFASIIAFHFGGRAFGK